MPSPREGSTLDLLGLVIAAEQGVKDGINYFDHLTVAVYLGQKDTGQRFQLRLGSSTPRFRGHRTIGSRWRLTLAPEEDR